MSVEGEAVWLEFAACPKIVGELLEPVFPKVKVGVGFDMTTKDSMCYCL